MKPTPNAVVRTYERINALLEANLQHILQEERHNRNCINLYDVGEYWVAFEQSAYLLEQMTPKEEHPVVLYLKQHPFPIVMHCSHYLRVKELCRQHALSKRTLDRLQFQTNPIKIASYRQWYNRICD